MGKKSLLPSKVANKIKALANEKKLSNADIAAAMGAKSDGLIRAIFAGKGNKRFNLIHIEKICAAFNYPVWKLFADEEELSLEAKNPTQQVLMKIVGKLSEEQQEKVLYCAMELQAKRKQEQQRGLGKKGNAA
jgi:transcriptional regulator with XRE-family HTH domain